MTKRELIEHCLTYPAVFEDYPFDEDSAVIKHASNKKMFALVGVLDGRLQVSLKCEPERADFLRNAYAGVIPGYHFNKKHWNTVYTAEDVPEDEIFEMIAHSFDLTKPRASMRKLSETGDCT
ncbi:MAG: MmcQ/YjbR family DNA-binding protein [Defluviitaleaceae bacterium]|nr:MmcQ/YjbR family DNA-binding protein [Defluviitaleaceae bacterium]